MKIINIGGAINAGKSTVSKIVARNLEKTVFIEVDDLLSDDEDAKLADFGQRIKELRNKKTIMHFLIFSIGCRLGTKM